MRLLKKNLLIVFLLLFLLLTNAKILLGQAGDSIYTFTGNLQYFTVPSNTHCLNVKMWGAAGSGSYGGAGGFSEALFPVNPGEVLTVIVGGSNGFGGGGNGLLGGYVAGGRSAIINAGTEIMDAGGGGGSGVTSHIPGGAGGGCVGQSGHGSGGTQENGGGAGGGCSTLPYIGSPFQGGDACNSGSIYGGGGGGGGYYGGGGGAAGTGAGTGGGGGAGHVPLGGTTITGNYGTPPNTNDSYYQAGIAAGAGVAGHGLVVVAWGIPCFIPDDTVNDASICKGDSITLFTHMGATYNWSPSDWLSNTTIHNPLAYPDTTTTYVIHITDSNGCIVVDTILVKVLALPLITISGDSSVCPGASTTLTASGGISYNWLPGGQITPAIAVAPIINTTYTVSVTDTNTCVNTSSVNVILHPIPVAGFVYTPECLGNTITFSNTSTIATGTIVHWEWSFGDNSTDSTAQNAAHSYLSCGDYNVTLTVITNNGCVDSTTESITVFCLPSLNAGSDDSVCFGETYTLSVTPNGSNYSYSWSTTSVANFSAIYNPLVAPITTTTYTITLTDNNGCINADSIVLNVDPQIVLSTTAVNNTCDNSCDGQTSIITIGGTSPYQYSWSNGCTIEQCNNLCPGTYSVTVSDTWGCSDTTSTLITAPPALIAFINTSSTPSCNNSCDATASVNVFGGTPGYTYYWNSVSPQLTPTADSLCSGTYICFVSDSNSCATSDTIIITPPTAISIITNTFPTDCYDSTGSASSAVFGGTPGYSYAWSPGGQTSQEALNLGDGIYTVTVADDNGCSETQTAIVGTVSGQTVVAAATYTNIMAPGTTHLNVTGIGNFKWSPAANLSCDTCQSPFASPLKTTNYCVVVTDTNNCIDSACITILVDYPCDLTVPNAFSPNNDGKNDVLILHGWDKCVAIFSMIIFNRWGEKVFESNNPSVSWDGYSQNDKDLNSSVFVYFIKATLISGEDIIRKGNISAVK